MRGARMAAIVLAALGSAFAAIAEEVPLVNGNTLLRFMQSTAPAERTHAMGYVAGISDSFDGYTFCIPVGVNVKQLTDVAQQFLEAHPQLRHRSGAILTMVSIQTSFPCSTTKPAPKKETL